MIPVLAIREAMGDLLAADAATLAPAALANKIHLVVNAFVPAEDLVIGDLTFAGFTGSTALACGVGAQPTGFDPDTSEQLITLLSPVGGWRWEVTGGALPETVYGYALVDNVGTGLLATALLPNPISLTEVGQEVNLGAIQLRINSQPIT